MSEYIIEIPDEYFASYDEERDMYYPDERDSAMPITPIVRCRDCVKWSFFDVEDGVRFGECAEFTAKVDKGCGHATREYGFCAWGERRGE